jgi:hypothetical protein
MPFDNRAGLHALWAAEQAAIGSYCLREDGCGYQLTVPHHFFGIESVSVGGAVALVDLLRTSQSHTSALDICEMLDSPDILTQYVCGAGSSGGDGFVAALCPKTKQLRWLIFSEFANPFVRLRAQQGWLLVENNCGHLWRINVRDLLQISISVPATRECGD